MSLAFGPVRARRYVDRVEVRAAIRSTVETCRAEGYAARIFVHGALGLGASALMTRVYDDDPEYFGPLIWVPAWQPDGQPLPLGEMLRFVLRRLGIAAADQESSLPELVQEYQLVTRGRRFMLILDDIYESVPLQQLVPWHAPEAVIGLTARARMRAPLHEDFVEFPLEPLPQSAAEELLRSKLPESSRPIEPAVVAELAAFSGGSPYILGLLAGHVAGRPHVAKRLVSDLRASLANLLELDEEQQLTQWLDFAVLRLPPELGSRYWLLSLIPGADFDVATAADALGADGAGTERVLDQLAELNLLLCNADLPSGPRYIFPSYVRAHAEARARDSDVDRSAVVEKICRSYLVRAAERDEALSGRWRVGPTFARPSSMAVPRDEALTWFEQEWLNVAACVRAAKRIGRHEIAYQLCVALFKYLHANKLVDVWIDVHNDGLDSARALDDLLAIMQLSNQRGAAQIEADDHAAAARDFEESLRAAQAAQRQLGPSAPLYPMAVIGEQSALEWSGKVAVAAGDRAAAMTYYERSWAVLDQAGDVLDAAQRERAYATLRLQRARLFVRFGEWSLAIPEIEAAFGYFDGRTAERENQAKCLVTLGEALFGAGRPGEAMARFEQAAELRRQDSAGRDYAYVMELVGDSAVATGDQSRAGAAYRTCLHVFENVGSPHAEHVRAKLASLTSAGS